MAEIILRFFDRTRDFHHKNRFYSSDCTIGWKYYDKLLIYILLPLIYILIVTLILTIYTFYFYKKKRKEKLLENRHKYIKIYPEPKKFYNSWMCTSILIGLFLSWPTIIKECLSIIPCKLFGNKYYLLQDLSLNVIQINIIFI